MNNEVVTYFENLISYLDLINEREGDRVTDRDIDRLVMEPIRMKLRETYQRRRGIA